MALGGCIIALSGCHLAAVWFSEEERNMAIGTPLGSQLIGGMVGVLLPRAFNFDGDEGKN